MASPPTRNPKQGSPKAAVKPAVAPAAKGAARPAAKPAPAAAAKSAQASAKSVAAPATKSAKAAKAGAPPAERARALAAAVEKIKNGLDAALMRFGERVGGELDRVRRELAADPPPPAKVLARIQARLEDVRIKPQKGRVKDFARLEDLAEDLGDLLPPPTP